MIQDGLELLILCAKVYFSYFTLVFDVTLQLGFNFLILGKWVLNSESAAKVKQCYFCFVYPCLSIYFMFSLFEKCRLYTVCFFYQQRALLFCVCSLRQ